MASLMSLPTLFWSISKAAENSISFSYIMNCYAYLKRISCGTQYYILYRQFSLGCYRGVVKISRGLVGIRLPAD